MKQKMVNVVHIRPSIAKGIFDDITAMEEAIQPRVARENVHEMIGDLYVVSQMFLLLMSLAAGCLTDSILLPICVNLNCEYSLTSGFAPFQD